MLECLKKISQNLKYFAKVFDFATGSTSVPYQMRKIRKNVGPISSAVMTFI